MLGPQRRKQNPHRPGSEANRPFSSFLHIFWVILRHHATRHPPVIYAFFLCWCNSSKLFHTGGEKRLETPACSKCPRLFSLIFFFPPFSFHVWLISWLGSIFFKILRNLKALLHCFYHPVWLMRCVCFMSHLWKLLGFSYFLLLSPEISIQHHSFDCVPFLQGLHYMFLGLLNGLSGFILYALSLFFRIYAGLLVLSASSLDFTLWLPARSLALFPDRLSVISIPRIPSYYP